MSIYKDTEETIAVIGGGPTSLSVNDGILEASRQLRPVTRMPCFATWLSNGRALGYGTPWEARNTVRRGEPIANQPRYAQSPLVSNPEDCAQTMAESPGAGRYNFDSRPDGGRYFASVAKRQIELARKLPGIAIDPLRGDVRAITRDNGRFRFHIPGHGGIISNRVVLATGHTPSRALNHLSGHPGYVDSPTDDDALLQIAGRSTQTTVVTFNGSGGSTLDAVKFLEENGYHGLYRVVSHGLNYWPFEPEKYDPIKPQISINIYAETVTKATKALTAGADVHETLMTIYQERSRRWSKVGFKHVLDAFPFARVAATLRDDYENETAAQSVENYHDHLTSPQSYEMVQRLLREKRLDFHKGSIEQITQDVEGFTLQLQDGRQIRARTLINAVPFVKGAGTPENGHTELFAQLIRDGLVRIDNKGIVQVNENGEASPGLYVVGPASHTGKCWGIESFRTLAHRAGVAAIASLSTEPAQSLKQVLPYQPIYHPPVERISHHVSL